MQSSSAGIPGAPVTQHGQPPRVIYLIKQTESAIRAHLDAVLREHGLTTMQYTALTVLQHREDLSSAQLARRSFVKPQTMHEMVVALERQGLVERHRSSGQRHVLLTRLTAEGRTKLAECQADVAHIEQQMTEDLTAAELAMLRALLERCHHALSRPLSKP
ncbi:MarR family transcriptional regulator [Micromonospora sp. KC213]|uniref:MarR family winged helix-turn-helix transcriptional regulator n=1 Tax=Micromonospora sp. KC213 TaxID=2530378 RepID=UPI001051B5FD|nr:MarR family transcriptional regulator [Micromonospora sp. KC213]TDC40306.1 MarR family transcriptional regulator [Micromonospora sp. KC213]